MTTVQARIDDHLKAQFVLKCAEAQVKQGEVLTKAIQAFVVHGKWWDDDQDAEDSSC